MFFSQHLVLECLLLWESQKGIYDRGNPETCLRWCGSLRTLPLSLQKDQTFNHLLGFMLLWFFSAFESDLDLIKCTYDFCLSPAAAPLTAPGNYVTSSSILWSIWLLNSVNSLEGKWGQKGRPKTVIVLLVLRDTLGEVSKHFVSFKIFWNGLLRHLVISLPVILRYMLFIIKTESILQLMQLI